MKAFWIDRETNAAKAIETDGSLDELYRYCHCDCIDITVIKVGGELFNVVVDDEGLLVDRPIVTVFDGNGVPMIVGSVVFFALDPEDDDLSGLSEKQVDILKNSTHTAIMSDLSLRTVVFAD